MSDPFDAILNAIDQQALYALHSLSDAEVYKLPEKLQSAELRRRIVMRARMCKDEKTLAEVLALLAEAKPAR
jgi:hypothetical protein